MRLNGSSVIKLDQANVLVIQLGKYKIWFVLLSIPLQGGTAGASTCRAEALADHEAASFSEPQMFLELQGAHSWRRNG